jgi:hypothetical protein
MEMEYPMGAMICFLTWFKHNEKQDDRNKKSWLEWLLG